MSVSKHNKTHKQRVNNYKQTIKQTRQKMNEQTQQPNAQQLPPVRSLPVWANDATIKLTGYEWEAIHNGLSQIQIAQQAAQAVLSRNIVDGVINVEFEKLDPTTLQYIPMTEEEKAPYRENLKATIEQIKNPIVPTQEIAVEASVEEPTPVIVGPDGVTPASEGAKIITM